MHTVTHINQLRQRIVEIPMENDADLMDAFSRQLQEDFMNVERPKEGIYTYFTLTFKRDQVLWKEFDVTTYIKHPQVLYLIAIESHMYKEEKMALEKKIKEAVIEEKYLDAAIYQEQLVTLSTKKMA